ncbi:uncharacterized protein LOC143040334 [Oratosquilla oratoria]|uniref:uncharacterized protein LOC143040334 n=1 Tax=Oratosquilla oratoria TaxID=337810 RepID=UPI003F77801E
MRKTKTLSCQSLETLVKYVINAFIYNVKQRKRFSEMCQRECEGQTTRKRSASPCHEIAKKRKLNEEEACEDREHETNTENQRDVVTKKRKYDDESENESGEEELENQKRLRNDQQNMPIPQTSGYRDIKFHHLFIVEDKITTYLSALPVSQWRELTGSMLKRVQELILTENDNVTISDLIKVIRCLFCGKLCDFSTDDFPFDTEDYTDVVISAIRKAVNLERLSFSLPLKDEVKKGILTENLSHLGRLQILHFMAKDRYSFHWVLPTIARFCTGIKELKIIYDASEFKEDENIRCLQNCSCLTHLDLFSYSGRSELKDITYLLENFVHIKHFFHKELPNAIMSLYDEWTSRRWVSSNDSGGQQYNSTTNTEETAEVKGERGLESSRGRALWKVLSLESLDLCCCQRGVGFQLMYLPGTYLESIAHLTPRLKSLRVVSHSCLKDMIKCLRNLESLSLHNSDFLRILGPALVEGFLANLQNLELCDIVRLDNDMLRIVGHNCKQLKSFSIIHSNFFDEGTLELSQFSFVSSTLLPPSAPTTTSSSSSLSSSPSTSSSSTNPFSLVRGDAPFSNLSTLTLLFTPPADRPFLSVPTTWQLGASHLRFLLGSSSTLTSFRMEYRQGEGRGGALARNALTEPILLQLFRVPRPFLTSVELLFPPVESCAVIEVLLKSCPLLEYVKDLNSWQVPSSEVDRILSNYSHKLDIT